MCNIAGYTGTRRAAPILIEMMRREEFMDGGLATGIATVHEGKLYVRKVIGDLDELLRSTDALDLPGTTGIIHSRTSKVRLSHTHPFTSEDGKLAIVLNGTGRDVDCPEFHRKKTAKLQEYVDRGFTVKSAYTPKNPKPDRTLRDGAGYHPSEIYALMLGDALASLGRAPTDGDLLHAIADLVLSEFPSDYVALMVHTELEGRIAVGDVTRPMAAGFLDGETFLATTPAAFPDEVQNARVTWIPPASAAMATPGGLTVSSEQIRNVRIEQPDTRILGEYYRRLEALLEGQEDDPKSLYDLPIYTEWSDLWSEPYVDCIYKNPGKEGLLKPYAMAAYNALWCFEREGRLHYVMGDEHGMPIRKFWLDPKK